MFRKLHFLQSLNSFFFQDLDFDEELTLEGSILQLVPNCTDVTSPSDDVSIKSEVFQEFQPQPAAPINEPPKIFTQVPSNNGIIIPTPITPVVSYLLYYTFCFFYAFKFKTPFGFT